jgi:nicotinamidase-related amidase
VKSFQGVDIATTLAELLTPAHLALVVYDMQVGICRQIADGDRVVSAVGNVLEVARKAGVRTIFTRHMSLPIQLMGSMAFRTAMAWQRTDDPEKVSPWFLRDSPGFALVPELQPLPSEVVFDKIAMSAFEGTPLAVTLRDCGVKAVAFVGIALEIGIEPSVRHAADLGFTPVIVSDACGFGHKVAADRSLAALTFSGDAVIVDQATFSAELRRQ